MKKDHKTKSFGNVDYWIAQWLKSERRESSNTAEAYKTDLRQFYESCGNAFDKVKIADILEYQSSLPDTYAPRTKARKIASVRSFYRFLNNREVTDLNLARIESAKIKRQIDYDKLLTEAEVKAIVKAATNDNHRLFVRFLYITGARITEALSVRWRDVEQQEEVEGAIVHITGKGQKHRSVFLPAPIYIDVLALWNDSTEDKMPVFSFIKDRHQALRIVKGLAKVAKIDKDVTNHSFRHAHGSHSLNNGASLTDVRDQFGHANISTTSLYLHSSGERATATRLKIQ